MTLGVSFETKGKMKQGTNRRRWKRYTSPVVKDSLFLIIKDAVNIITWAPSLEGCFTAYGSHAAGIVISDNHDVSDYLPLRYNTTKGQMTTQCDMVQVEENGLLKFDFLGLKTLNVISDASRLIEKRCGKIIDFSHDLDLNDERVYKSILQTGRTGSVFQFESTRNETDAKVL